ncbi:MAG TPA: EF-P lysine aminoacylase EpmA [Gammaproteobacteria bacterium]|jgi:lysyl-tRNA synthetase class 2
MWPAIGHTGNSSQMDTGWRPTASIELLRIRAAWLTKIRSFFAARDVLEVDTPVLSNASVTDPNIESLLTTVNGKRYYLQTSPELYMKRLLAAGSGPIFQVAHVFRDGEQGRLHNPEFTLVEWYRPAFDQFQLMREVSALVSELTGREIPEEEVRYLTYTELFEQHTGLDPMHENWSALNEFCASRQLHCPVDDHWEGAMDWLLAMVIQPVMRGLVFVNDFPAAMASLAKLDDNNPRVARRFELFIDGIEMANGFEELTDVDEQQQRFIRENQQRQAAGKPLIAIDEAFLGALGAGIPETSGVALGLDRLLMWSLQLDHVTRAMSFSPFVSND